MTSIRRRLPRQQPARSVYTPDLSRPAVNENWNHSEDLRLTWQATAEAQVLALGRRLQRCRATSPWLDHVRRMRRRC